jgi:type II secretory pathway pseudopilin PulG
MFLKQNKKIYFSKGLTLLEVVVYVSIVAIIFVIATNTFLIISNAWGHARVKRNIATQGHVAMERILYEVRLAHSIDTVGSTLGSSPGVLDLDTIANPSDPTETTRTFSISGTTLMFQDGVSPAVPMTTGVEISNLVFYSITTPNSEGVRVEIIVEDGVGRFEDGRKFQGTAMLRRSY